MVPRDLAETFCLKKFGSSLNQEEDEEVTVLGCVCSAHVLWAKIFGPTLELISTLGSLSPILRSQATHCIHNFVAPERTYT